MISRALAFWVTSMVLAALPASNTFKLDSYGFGTGGTANSNSTNYRINGIAGDAASGSHSSTSYKVLGGETHQKEANVPTINISNDERWYNKLKIIIGIQNNPTDTKYAVAISSDNFASDVRYVKSDFTVGASLAFSDYLDYSSWGSGTGVMVRGLVRSTVYTVKAKAIQGDFTESPWGPTDAAATQDPQLTFDIDVSPTNSDTSPPYEMNFTSLFSGTVVDTIMSAWVDFDTNGETGGRVYVSGENAGLESTAASYTIDSATADLAGVQEGFGAQGATVSQASGGPFTISAPYNGGGHNVGITDTVLNEIFASVLPIVDGRGSFILKAKTAPLTPHEVDYVEILTVVAAGSF